MFGVLETVTVPARRWWARESPRVSVREKPRYVSLMLETPLEMRESRARRRAARALRVLKRFGSAGVVLPKGFPYPDLPGSCGLAVSSAVPLLRRLAAPLCRFAVREAGVPWERVRLTLAGARSTPELLSAAQNLAPSVRALHIDAGDDTDAVCYLLRSRYGISASGRAVRAEDGIWDVCVLFAVPRKQPVCVPGGTLVLNLGGGVPALSGGREVIDGAFLEPPRSMRKEWPAGCDDNALLAALLATGQVSLHDIGIKGLTHGERMVKLYG